MLLRASRVALARRTAPAQVGRLYSTNTFNDFNELRERSLLRHVISTSKEGDPDSVTGAMDEFWNTYFNGEGTAEWKVVEHAGLSDRVFVEIGELADRLPKFSQKFGLSGPLDAVLLDHDVGSYLPDLQLLEKAGHIDKGTVVLCDWSLYPGSEDRNQAPTDGHEFMKYLNEIGATTRSTSVRDKEVFTVSAQSWIGVV